MRIRGDGSWISTGGMVARSRGCPVTRTLRLFVSLPCSRPRPAAGAVTTAAARDGKSCARPVTQHRPHGPRSRRLTLDDMPRAHLSVRLSVAASGRRFGPCFCARSGTATGIRSRPTSLANGRSRWKCSRSNRWRTALNRSVSGADCRALSRTGSIDPERQTIRSRQFLVGSLAALPGARILESERYVTDRLTRPNDKSVTGQPTSDAWIGRPETPPELCRFHARPLKKSVVGEIRGS
jgi:hypothetical protein